MNTAISTSNIIFVNVFYLFYIYKHTLQFRLLSSSTFLAAISLCTNDLSAKQASPSTTCLQNCNSRLGRLGSFSNDGVLSSQQKNSL